MDATLPPVPSSETLQPSATVAPTPIETTGAPLLGTVTSAPLESTERVELSAVEKMVIGVAIAITIILIGILVSVSTRV